MTALIAGLVLFLGIHSVRIVADDFRTARVAQWGIGPWKLLYTLVSFAGLGLIIWGYSQARAEPVVVWNPPRGMNHLAALLMIPSFVLVVAGNLPGTKLKAALGHPMVIGVKLWAFAHLLANGMLADVVLFGAFLAWAVVDLVSLRRRDRAEGKSYAGGSLARDALAVAIGLVAWVVFGFWLHGWLVRRAAVRVTGDHDRAEQPRGRRCTR
jgi:uncharacterized membrane protein